MSAPGPVLSVWSHAARHDGVEIVLPDGCRDLILRQAPGSAPVWMISGLPGAAQQVGVGAGDTFQGVRLRPGAAIRADAFAACVRGREIGFTDMLARLEEFVRPDPDVEEALTLLAEDGPVALVARRAGLGLRAFQRLLAARTGRPARWWRSLARVRLAAALLDGATDLSGIAAEAGYADQAHMTREMRRWFGVPPARLRADAALSRLARESGYAGGATGVHNSTRKPSGSAT